MNQGKSRHALLLIGLGLLLILAALPAFAQSASSEDEQVHVTVLVEGLLNPVGLALGADGTLFIAEEGTGERDDSAGVSARLPDGTVGRVISGLPSSRDSGDLSGVPLVATSPDETTLYLGSFNAQQLWTLPLEIPFTLPEQPYTMDDLGTALERLNNVYLLNPFDMTFTADGTPVVTDASGNGVATANANGTVRFFHRFERLVNPTNQELRIDPVPTGIARVGDEYLVTLFGGCPYPDGGGELVIIDMERNQRTVVDDLNMPIDVAVGADGTVWVLEFATFTPNASCFSGMGYRPRTGRLSRLLSDGTLETVVDHLDFPGAVLPLPDGSLYISEVFDGRILQVTFDGSQPDENAVLPQLDLPPPNYVAVDDADAALRSVIATQGLQPFPGLDLREGDTAIARLGRDLFFDPLLSGDQNVSCATCHHPALAMADARVLPIGSGGFGLGPERDFTRHITLSEDVRGDDPGEIANPFIGRFVPRNSATILNSALFPVQFWDGRVQSYALGATVTTQEREVNRLRLEDALLVQALFPVISDLEMAGGTFGGEAPGYIRRTLVERILAIPDYRLRFESIFGTADITPVEVAAALAAFERRFIFTAAPWDVYIAGDSSALTDEQKRGALLFYGVLNPQVNCAVCHSGNLLTDMQFHNLLTPQVGPGHGDGEDGREDWGRAQVTFDWRDRYAFRTPSLRNVTLTAPYFHSGAYATLDAVIWHHANIWHSAANYDPSAHLPPDFMSSVRPFSLQRQGSTAAPLLVDGLPLSEQDVQDLVAFLHALTDPRATDLTEFIPDAVPSGLALDPLPTAVPAVQTAAVFSNSSAANSEDEDDTGEPTDWRFVNVAPEVGLHFQHGAFQTAIYDDPAAMMGAGLCWLDYDKDGWLDLYLVNSYAEDEEDYLRESDGLPRNALYRNTGGSFVNVSEETGTGLTMRGNGCVAADFNLDGWVDLHITADGPNVLLWNNGDGTFDEGAEAAGIATPEWNSAAAVGDLNGDGWPDLFVGSYIDLDYEVPNPVGAFPQDYYGLPDRLYLSTGLDETGRVTFREVTREVGLFRDERALGALFSDFDNDGDLDLYIANDGQANRLYENEPLPDDPLGIGFRFLDTHDTANVGDTGSGMGIAGGDWDGDGWFDMLVTNWEAELNALYRNETQPDSLLQFQYSTYRIGMMGLGNNATGWGTAFADFDLDTDLDLLTVNGRVPITNLETDPEHARLYLNRLVEGRPGEFRDWTQIVGLWDVGPLLARGSAVADYDNDGDLDIAINVIAGSAVLLRNEGAQGHWLTVDLGRFAPGTVIEVQLPDGRVLKRELHAGSSYLASEDPRIHFGLGSFDVIPALRVYWSDGSLTEHQGLSTNQIVRVAPQ